MVGSDDESGSEQEVDWMEEGGEGGRMKWSLVNRKRKKTHQQNADSDKEVGTRKDIKRNEGHKVIVTFESPGSRNPIKEQTREHCVCQNIARWKHNGYMQR